MRKVFISYARQNKRDVDQPVEHLRVLGCDTWTDSSLHGGQDWWEEVLRRIADCDTFIPIISRDALSSTACRREFDWTEALGKPVLPVAVEPPPKALPGRFSRRQIVDYYDRESRDRDALELAGGLNTLAKAPPLPDPLPEPPAAPLSYLTDLTANRYRRSESVWSSRLHAPVCDPRGGPARVAARIAQRHGPSRLAFLSAEASADAVHWLRDSRLDRPVSPTHVEQ
jgi:hypothetical protein